MENIDLNTSYMFCMMILEMLNLFNACTQHLYIYSRPANSGGSWEPSSQKIFGLSENVKPNSHIFCLKSAHMSQILYIIINNIWELSGNPFFFFWELGSQDPPLSPGLPSGPAKNIQIIPIFHKA